MTSAPQIEAYLASVDSLIESNTAEASAIVDAFKHLKGLIDDIEEDERLHGHFKYAYHSKLSCYYASIGKSVESEKQLEIAGRFEKFFVVPQAAPSAPPAPTETTDNDNDDDEDSFVTYQDQNEIDSTFAEQLVDCLNDFIAAASKVTMDSEAQFKRENLNAFRMHVMSFVQLRPVTFDDYLKLSSMRTTLDSLFDEVDVTLAELSENAVDIGDLVSKSTFLKQILFQVALVKTRVEFMKRVLKSSDPIALIYNVTDMTDENINKQFRRLSLHFHPDKVDDWLPSAHLNLANEFFVFLSETRAKLLKSYSKTGLNDHLASASSLWRMAKDYKRLLLKGDYEHLQVLAKADVLDLGQAELRKRWEECLSSAYSQYKAACRLADQLKVPADQLKLRGYLALLLYESGKDQLVSQLYALAALRLVIKYSNLFTEKDLSEAKKIYEKVSTGSGSIQATSATATAASTAVVAKDPLSVARLDDHSGGSSDVAVSASMSYESRQKLDNAISDHLNEAVAKLVVKSDREIVKYQANQEEILRTKAQGMMHRVAGVSLLGAGAAGGTLGAWALQAEIAAGTALALGPIAWIGFGVFFVGTGLFTGYHLMQKSNKILEEPKIREKLNEILKNALGYFDRNMFEEFLAELAKEYAKGKRLLDLQNLNKSINSVELIGSLIRHGFRPDGIAYLLNLVGEVLISGRVSLSQFSSDDLKNQALRVFDATLDESLLAEAEHLDKRIKELRLKSMNSLKQNISIIRSSLLDFYLSRNYTSIAREHLADSKSMSFRFRLEEMRNIARLNKAIMRLFKNRDDEIRLAEEDIKAVRSSVDKNYQFIGKAALRLDAIEDFFWIVTGKSVEAPLAIKSGVEEVKVATSLQYLNERLKRAKSPGEKVAIFIKKASYYENKAKEHEQAANMIDSLREWKEAMVNFDEALAIDKHNACGGIGHARCLVKLAKYSKAIGFLRDNHRFLSDLPEFWLLLSIAYQKDTNYGKAKESITQALGDSKFVHDRQILRQKQVLDRLDQTPLDKRVQDYSNTSAAVRCEKGWYDTRRYARQESASYNILSIDGGGVRGILPALWLCEIEKQTKRPISHLFNMTAGTSVGAIIAAALNMPKVNTELINAGEFSVPVSTFSDFEPQFSAFDVLQLFRLESKKIFSTNQKGLLDYFLGTSLSSDKYSNAGRQEVLGNFFSTGTLKDVLGELVMTAVSQNDMTNTHLFNTFDVRSDSEKDAALVDVLMASTAAPSFFPVYAIKNRGSFMDGGVHLNNPAMAAYGEALRNGVAKEKIFVLSLGTGSYIPDPFNPELCQGQLFWAQNFHTVALAAQECNVDRDMKRTLGTSRYERWQIYLDRPVALDDCHSLDYLSELACQYIEELYESDDDKMNKLIEHLLREY